jgi:aminodeoxyfutalosine deaminase
VPAEAVHPKIELHVHLEGTIAPATLLEMARANGVELPAEDENGIAELYRFRDIAHFVEVWKATTNVPRRREDFARIALDHARRAAAHGAVYIEAIFSPAERIARGVDPDAIFGGYCDGAELAAERHGVELRLTPDLYRGLDPGAAVDVARHAVRFRDRGVVALGIGGDESAAPASDYAEAFAIARAGGLGSVPHAGETAGPESIREALDVLRADRIRHGITAARDPGLMAELAERRIVLDVCPTANVRLGAVESIEQHPLPELVAAGVLCSISTDDPAMFGTDLTAEYELAARLGVGAEAAFAAGLAGALCDEGTRAALARLTAG